LSVNGELGVVGGRVCSRNSPGEPKTKENINSIRASNVSDSRVSVLTFLSSNLTCKGIWQGGSNCDKCNGSDTQFNSNGATHHLGDLTNYDNNHTYNNKTSEERSITTSVMGWRDNRENEFPSDREEMQYGISS